MKLNADLRQAVLVNVEDGEWVPSPLPGVERRMLERDGDEVARATSLVRYAPGSSFSAHTHTGGEEFFVLEGTFSDESGDYPAGSYVHNPVGSSHTPRSVGGCTIFVKLYWMHPEDQQTVRLDATADAGWSQLEDGVEHKSLHAFEQESSALLRLAPGARMTWRPSGGAEILVIEGRAQVDLDGRPATLKTRGWARFPVGATPVLESGEGCLLFCKSGHLAAAPASPSS